MDFPINIVCDLKSVDCDGIVVVAPDTKEIPFAELTSPLNALLDVDKSAMAGTFVVPAPELPAKRIVFSGTGPLDKDYDDVRRYLQLLRGFIYILALPDLGAAAGRPGAAW